MIITTKPSRYTVSTHHVRGIPVRVIMDTASGRRASETPWFFAGIDSEERRAQEMCAAMHSGRKA